MGIWIALRDRLRSFRRKKTTEDVLLFDPLAVAIRDAAVAPATEVAEPQPAPASEDAPPPKRAWFRRCLHCGQEKFRERPGDLPPYAKGSPTDVFCTNCGAGYTILFERGGPYLEREIRPPNEKFDPA
jgi:hypothetical protein